MSVSSNDLKLEGSVRRGYLACGVFFIMLVGFALAVYSGTAQVVYIALVTLILVLRILRLPFEGVEATTDGILLRTSLRSLRYS